MCSVYNVSLFSLGFKETLKNRIAHIKLRSVILVCMEAFKNLIFEPRVLKNVIEEYDFPNNMREQYDAGKAYIRLVSAEWSEA